MSEPNSVEEAWKIINHLKNWNVGQRLSDPKANLVLDEQRASLLVAWKIVNAAVKKDQDNEQV